MLFPLCGVRFSAKPPPFGTAKGVVQVGADLLHVVFNSVHPSSFWSAPWSPSQCCSCHRVLITSDHVSTPSQLHSLHLLCDWCNAQPLPDVDVRDVVRLCQAQAPSQHPHFHCVKGLFVLCGGWPTLWSIKGHRAHYALVDLWLKAVWHSSVAQDLTPLHPGLINPGSYVWQDVAVVATTVLAPNASNIY